MSRIVLPQSLRETAKARLIQTYRAVTRCPGDKVRVTSLGFSHNPAAWRISSKTRRTLEAPGTTLYAPPVVHIRAILSPDWAEPMPFYTPEGLFLLSIPERGPRPCHIILGCHALTPPPGTDKADLLCLSEAEEPSQLRLKTTWVFRLASGEHTHLVGRTTVPANTRRAAANFAAAHEEFRTHLARKMTARLLPRNNTDPLPESME
jgi:hypothetical protein